MEKTALYATDVIPCDFQIKLEIVTYFMGRFISFLKRILRILQEN
jgi:hypothetical protein